MTARLRLALLLLVGMIGAACTGGESGPATHRVPIVPIFGEDGSAVALVPVIIAREGPVLFVLDTGAPRSSIDRELAQRLTLAGAADSNAGTVPIALETPIRVDDLRIGERSLGPVTLLAADVGDEILGMEVVGILGSDLLSRFGAVTVDYGARALVLREREADQTGALAIFDFSRYPVWLNAVIFVIAAAVIWFAGYKLERYADLISSRTGLGQAFVGLLLLAVATSLPEVATVLTASFLGSVPLAVGNLLGSVTINNAILAAMDGILVTGALTVMIAKPQILLQGLLVVVLLAIALAGIATGSTVALFGIGLSTLTILVIYVLGMYMSHRYASNPRWEPVSTGSDHHQNVPTGLRAGQEDQAGQGNEQAPRQDGEQSGGQDSGDDRWRVRPRRDEEQAGGQGEGGDEQQQQKQQQRQKKYEGTSTKRIMVYFGVAALVILVAGWTIARVGDALATQTGLGGTLVGYVLLSVATSLPELSTTSTAVRFGNYPMAISNIFGSNAANVLFLLLADLGYREGPILAAAAPWAAFAAALGIVMTCTYLWGVLERANRTIFGMGIDSAIVLGLYVAGLGVIYYLR